MARPKRGNYAYGDAGQARYRKAVREYNDKMKKLREEKTKIDSTKKNIEKQKTAGKTTTKKVKELTKSKATSTAKKPVTKKPVVKSKTTTKPVTKKVVTKKPVAKKPVAKKPVAKKPVAKKPVGKVPAKKPLISNKNKLRIKKGAKQAADTTKKVVKKGVEKGKKLASNVKKKVDATKKAFNKPSPTKRPTTRLQKLASKGNKLLKSAGKYTKNQVLPKAKKDLLKIGKGIAKDPKSLVKGAKGLGVSIAADRLVDAGMTRIFKRKGETVAQYKKRQAEFRKDTNPINAAKRTVKGIKNVTTGKNWYTDNMTKAEKMLREKRKNKNQLSTTKNINKQKKVNNNKNVTNKKLKVNKTQGPTVKSINKTDYNVDTKQGLDAYNKAKKTKKTPLTSKPKKMSAIEKRNRQVFGDAHVDKLRAKNKDFQAMKKKKMTKAEFIKRYPNSITAQKAKGLRK